ncbi:serine/threonine-protein kinase [Streptomyces sp. NPDC057565]|uniref:serine/threonine-protein kinase n=1 Tax=Streptomyces sp. NPDC057565 TaxID=3346169 RepID=UPI0036BB002E
MTNQVWGWSVHGEMLADRYGLIEPLGSGGMGQVWRGWDSALGREVAVKLLAAAPGDAGAAERFRHEAHAAARLTHANIAAVYDFGHAADGRPFLVIELVRGRSLADVLAASGQLAWTQAADLGAQAARALTAAHAAGVVHRDIKPANLLLSDDGVVKVVDFGIAQLAEHAAADDGLALGTAAYTAPEQALRHPVGPAADLYALGCVLYELLAGQPPFPGQDIAGVLYRHVHEHPAPLDEIRPDAPPHLVGTVHALLAKNPTDRPGDAADIARHLAAVAAEARAQATQFLPPVDATAPLPAISVSADGSPPSRSRPRQGARPPLPLVLGGLVAGGACLLAVLFLVVGGDSSKDTASSAPPTISEPPSPSPSSAPTRGPSPTPTPSVKQTTAQDAATLARQLSATLAVQSGSMKPDLYDDAQKKAAEINKRVEKGETDKAADKARDLRKRLTDAQQKGEWSGDSQVMQLLNQLAAFG